MQAIAGFAALVTSGWLLFDVSMDFAALGSIISDDEMTADKRGRVFIGNLAFKFIGKMFGAWVLAIVSGVLLS